MALVIRCLCLITVLGVRARPQAIAPIEQEIRDEAARPNNSPGGRPLPLVAHWNTGEGNPAGFTPEYQLQRIESGNRLLLSFTLPKPGQTLTLEAAAYYEISIKRAAALKLPVAFLNTQWEVLLYDPSYPFYGLPPALNPNVIQTDGGIRKQLDPMGPIAPWTEAGRLWGSSPLLQYLQQLYPDPPFIMFLSNNEANRIPWTDIESSKRYLDAYGLGRSEAFRREVVASGWIERDRALQEGIRGALTNLNWRSKVMFVGFNAFGPPHFGRWQYWYFFSLVTENYIDPAPLAWDGGSPPYYLYDWNPTADYQVWGPQIESFNWIFMIDEALQLNPKFFLELSTWNGGPTKIAALSAVGPFTPPRYGAMIQFGMWSNRPRVIREFAGWTDTVTNAGPWFDPAVAAVDAVHQNPILRRFWRSGTLVANPAFTHPYQYVWPALRYASVPRWYLLDATVDPPHPFSIYSHLLVFAETLVLGTSPSREWLIYAHAPKGNQNNVGITIPGYGQVWVNVPIEGAYYLVREGVVGAQTINVNAPASVSVTPAAGSGPNASLSFLYQDSDGASDLRSARVLMAGTPSTAGACYVEYSPVSSTFALFDDTGKVPTILPVSGGAENSQCQLLSSGTAAALSGKELRITLNLVFKPAFNGPKTIFMQARDAAENLSAWSRAGTWTVITAATQPIMVSLTPNTGTGASQVFTAVYRHRNGATDLAWVQLLISTGPGAQACYLHYQRAAGTLYLFDDLAQNVSIVPPAPGVVQNSQCYIAGSGTTVTISGTDLTLGVTVGFKAAFAGPKNVYMQAYSTTGALTPWIQMGTWYATEVRPAILSAGPASGSGSTATITAVFRHPLGARYLKWIKILISEGFERNVCEVTYVTGSNLLALADDDYVASVGSITPGSGFLENSQCLLRGSGSSATLTATDLSLSITVTFKPAFAGAKRVLLVAEDLDSRVTQLIWGTWGVVGDPNLPTVVSLAPSSGSGSTQIFKAVFRDPNGAANLLWAQMLIYDGETHKSCYLHYQVPSNTFFLFADDLQGGSAVSPGSGVAVNSQCLLRGAGSTASTSGTDLTLAFNVTFASAGSKRLYLQAIDAEGNPVTWKQMGTWTSVRDQNLPSIVSLSPNAGTGSSQVFTAVYRDPNGAVTLSWAQLLISSTGSAVNSCYIHYQVATNTFFLFNDTITDGDWVGAGAGSVENSQCILKGSRSGGTVSGTDLTVTFNLAFKSAFAGGTKVYLLARDADGNITATTQMGTWTAVADANRPSVVSLAPNSGNRASQVFTGSYRHPAGATALAWVQMLFTASGSAVGACYVHYQRTTNTIFLFDDTVTDGVGLAPGSGTAENSQCIINGVGSSVTVAGTDLALTLNVTFKPTFTGVKKVYMTALDLEGNLAPWSQMGTWTVP